MTLCANYTTQHQRCRGIFVKVVHSLVQFGISWLIGSIYSNYRPTVQWVLFTNGGKNVERWSQKIENQFFDGLIIYFWWNIWNEGNRRTFRQEEKIMTELTYQIKEEVQQFQQATEVVNRIAHNLLVVSSVFVVCMVFFLCVDWWWCIVGMGVVVF